MGHWAWSKIVTDRVEQRREKVDEQWELYARKLPTLAVRALPGIALLFVSAIAGACVSSVWSGFLPTPAPHLFAIALAVLSATAFAGFVVVFAKIQTAAPRTPFLRPGPASKAAFLLREWSASQQRLVIIFFCANQALVATVAFTIVHAAQTEPNALRTWLALAVCSLLGLEGIATAIMVFCANVRQQDEFDTAMRGRAAQIGFWSALIVLGSVLIAMPFLGPAILPWLPFGFMLMVTGPGLSFVVLTRPGKTDG